MICFKTRRSKKAKSLELARNLNDLRGVRFTLLKSPKNENMEYLVPMNFKLVNREYCSSILVSSSFKYVLDKEYLVTFMMTFFNVPLEFLTTPSII